MRRLVGPLLALLTVAVAAGALAGGASAADGVLDPSFGTEGQAASDPTALQEVAADAVLDPQGRIVVVFDGFKKEGEPRAFVARYLPTGAIDPSFGTGGVSELPWTTGAEEAEGVALDAAGRIVVAGFALNPPPRNFDFAAARYLPDGQLDGSFGEGGVKTVNISGQSIDSGKAVAIDRQNRVVIAGRTEEVVAGKLVGSIGLVRLTEAGTLDPGFGNGGIAKVRVGSEPRARAETVAVDSSERIVAAGAFGPENGPSTPVVIRLLQGGSLDPGFGSGGLAPVSFSAGSSGEISDLALSGDGILVTGSFEGIDKREGFGVGRLRSDGSLDPTFGIGGTVAELEAGTALAAEHLTVDAAGRIVVAGSRGEPLRNIAALYRFTPTGTLDSTFGNAGVALADFRASGSAGVTPLVDDSGRYLLFGDAGTNENSELGLARFLTIPSAASTPGSGGTSKTTATASPPVSPPPPPPKCEGRTATIVGTAGADHLKGTKKADVIVGLGGNDTIAGLGGADLICAGAGADKVSGGGGADRILGEGGNDRLAGEGGADKLLGGPGNDTLAGGPGHDHEVGGPGTDRQH